MASPELYIVGLSHQTASVEVRESCAVSGEELRSRLEVVHGMEGVLEVYLLSTCNRTEVLIASGKLDANKQALDRALREVVFRGAPEEALYTYRGVESVLHLFRVACGLESLILGESQILSQLKEALAAGRKAGTVARTLEPLLQHALNTGKRVRNETAVGSGTLSVARAGVEIASHVCGQFDDATVLIVGAGETGRLVASHLHADGVGRLVFLNRTFSRAEEAARKFDGQAAGLDRLSELVLEADLILVCVEGAPDLIDDQAVPLKGLSRRDRPLVMVDLSVPRAVQREVADHKDVLAFDLDDIAKVVDGNRQERERAGEEAAPILVAETHKFLSLRTYARFSPRIARLRERFSEAREEHLDAVAGEESSPDMLELAHRLTKHLLDVALDELKQSARDAIEPESLDRAYQRYLENQ